MAPPLSDPSNRDVVRRQNKNAPFKFLLPLIYAPVLPLIRISLRRKPVLRDRVFTAVLAGAMVHGIYLLDDEAEYIPRNRSGQSQSACYNYLYDAESK
ncbi:hypothetical protein CASFOL_013720 [Castilleja foliolosa]|uniref:Uncharacterized protein n=1 Tax=Castilleja foliolosa TaxID=1961234 RepID=A0ABD3DKU2_9LAMI